MYRLTMIVILAVLLFSGYWFAGSQLLQAAPDRTARLLAAEGVDLQVGSVATTGFPARFDTGLTDLRLTHPAWAWQGARLDIQADSLRPLAATVTFPSEQTLRIAGQSLRVTSQDWQISAALQPTTRLAFDRGSLRMANSEVVSDAGWQTGLGGLVAIIALAADQEAIYAMTLTADDITFPRLLRDQIDPQGTLGPQLDAVRGAARLTLARPLDRNLQGRLPDLDHVALDDLQIDWGPVTVQMSGDIAIDAAGMPTGVIMLRTRQWQTVIDLLITSGTIDAGLAQTVTRLAGFLVDGNGVLNIPLAFQDGIMLAGPMPIGPVPRLR